MATSPVSSSPGTAFFLDSMPKEWNAVVDEPQEGEALDEIAGASSLDPAARDRVLLDHLPLVRFVARKIHERLPQHVEFEDLVSAGVIGLIDAFNKFDAGKNIQLRTYAQFRIRGAILDSLRTMDWGSRELRRKGRNIEEAVRKLTHQLNRRPSEAEVAAELGMALNQYQRLLVDLRSLEIGSMQEPRAEDSGEEDLAYLPTSPEEDPLFLCMKGEISEGLCAAIAKLSEREARVLALYYVEEMTLKEIGEVVGLVESRVSQIRAAAVAALRAQLTKTGTKTNAFRAAKPKPVRRLVPAAVIRKNVVSICSGRPRASAR